MANETDPDELFDPAHTCDDAIAEVKWRYWS
jgi:hypothetical protein